MTHGADIIRPDFPRPEDALARKGALAQSLMREGMAQLIRHRLSTPATDAALRPDLHLITQLRQSGMAILSQQPDTGYILSMHGVIATAATPRGVLWEWSNAALGMKGTPK